jgi:hypothetical protein
MLTFKNARHRTEFMIESVTRDSLGRSIVRLGDVSCRVARGTVASAHSDTLISQTPLFGYGCADDGQHAGRWLMDAMFSRSFEIASTAVLPRPAGTYFPPSELDVLSSSSGDAQGSFAAGSSFWIVDVGAGDAWILPSRVYVERTATGDFSVTANVPVHVSRRP